MELLIIGASLVALGFLTGLSGAVLPGPFLVFVLSESMKKGFLSGPLSVLGHISVESPTILVLLFLGLRFTDYFIKFKAFIYLIGGITLILMAFYASREVSSISGSISTSTLSSKYETAGSYHRYWYGSSILGGFLLTAFNPSFIPWWMTIGWATLITGMQSPIWNGVLFVIIGHFLSDFAWYSSVSYSFSRGKRFLSERGYKVAMLAITAVMAALGLVFILIGSCSLLI